MYNYNRQYRSRYGCFQSRYVCMYVLEDIDRQICLYDSDMNDVLRTGLFMALQPKMITCGKWVAAISMGMKFVVGPAVMAVASLAIGIRGKLLHVAIIQVFIHSFKHSSYIYIYSSFNNTTNIYILDMDQVGCSTCRDCPLRLCQGIRCSCRSTEYFVR